MSQGLPLEIVQVFFDDILVHNLNKQEQYKQLDKVLKLLRVHKLYVKQSKFCFLQMEVGYVGHIVSQQGVKIDLRKIEAIVS